MFEDFRTTTKECHFLTDLERRNNLDLSKFIKRIEDLEEWKVNMAQESTDLET
jgi:uncharacterized protein (UPF0335 family)